MLSADDPYRVAAIVVIMFYCISKIRNPSLLLLAFCLTMWAVFVRIIYGVV